VRFAKAHGLGNDFILVAKEHAPADEPIGPWAVRLCDRHRGIGGDGIVLYEPVADGVRMRLINADGGEAEISGNGLRCVAGWAVAQGIAPPTHVVHTAAGPKPVAVTRKDARHFRIGTDLGPPILRSDRIPVSLDPPQEAVLAQRLDAAGCSVVITATSMGNPHCALFLEAPPEDRDFLALGPALEHHPFFPRRTNVEFVTVKGRGEIAVRFWERGVGPTEASGTGAASAVVASILTGRTDRKVRVHCAGGTLDVDWPEGGSVHQAGDVELLFEGEWAGGVR